MVGRFLLVAACVFIASVRTAVIPITTTAQMCAGSDPLYSPQTVTTIGYPAMVTASECECTVIPGPDMKELISRVSFKREDQSSSCESHIFFTFHNSTYVFCPSDDVDSGVSFDAQFKQNDDRLFRFTLKNPNLILLSGAIEFTTNPTSNYQIDCVNQGGSVWANSVQPVLDVSTNDTETTTPTIVSITTSPTSAQSLASTTNVFNGTTSSTHNGTIAISTANTTETSSNHTLTTATHITTTVHPDSTTEHTTQHPNPTTDILTSSTPYAKNTTSSNHTSPVFSSSTRNMNVSTPTVHPASSTTTEKPSHVTFDLASFFGGIILSAGLIAILYFAYKCYTKRKNGDGHFRQFQNPIDA